MAENILQMKNITKIYNNGFVANDNVSFEVQEGEIHGLIGENGAGKTTLMKILFGLEEPQEGKIYVDGKEVTFTNPLDAFDKGIGMVHQHFMQCDDLTVAENIVLGMVPGKGIFYNEEEAIALATEASKRYKLPINPLQKIKDISVGEKQKVELLKALIRGARILILDEPTAVLTPQETDTLFMQLKHLKEQGYGIVFISHKLDEVMEVCDRVTVLRRGRVTGHEEISKLNEKTLANMIVGRDMILNLDKGESVPSKTVLEIKNIGYQNRDGKTKLKSINLNVKQGEIIGIAGVEGNGQTELSNIISGLTPIQTGNIYINGSSIKEKTVKEIRDVGLAHISEDRMLDGCAVDLSIRDNISSIYLDDRRYTRGFFLRKKEIDSFVEKAIKDFEIACYSKDQPLHLLSGGNIQKVIVAREFLSEKPFILANQPTRGIDIGTAGLIRRNLIKYARSGNAGVLLISSDLNEVLEVSDRLIVMRDGLIVAHFAEANIVTDKQLGEYMLGLRTMSVEEMGL